MYGHAIAVYGAGEHRAVRTEGDAMGRGLEGEQASAGAISPVPKQDAVGRDAKAARQDVVERAEYDGEDSGIEREDSSLGQLNRGR